MSDLKHLNDWAVLTQFFPNNWEIMAKELGALGRKRKLKSATDLLRILLIHLVDGASLKETVTIAKLSGIANISDVALLKRIKSSSEWFRWMTNQFLLMRGIDILPPNEFKDYRIKTVDASLINEPGNTGSYWRLHYSMELFGLKCNEFHITTPLKGESFLNFTVHTNDIFIGDRAYGRFKGMKYIQDQGGNFIVRFAKRAYRTYDTNGNEFNLLDRINKISIGDVLELKVEIGTNRSKRLPARIFAIKKSEKEAEESIKKVIRIKRKNNIKLNPEVLEYHRYVIITTSLPESISAKRIMELYRLRWQIELSFKRLKSIFGLGHLPKKDEISARAWLHGKIFVAQLAQLLVDGNQLFPPWGYPIQLSTE